MEGQNEIKSFHYWVTTSLIFQLPEALNTFFPNVTTEGNLPNTESNRD